MKISVLSKFVYVAIIVIIIVVLGFIGFFLYEYFYQTLVQSQVINIVESEVTFKFIDINLWQEVNDKLTAKATPNITLETKIPNPFSPLIEVK